MKKTLTINLGGTVYHIDEDAYRLLDNYLSNLKHYFRKQKGADEIVDDIEMRISELFAERVTGARQVVTITDVEDIIARVGKPEDFGVNDEEMEGEGENEKEEATAASGSQQPSGASGSRIQRRLFRDPDNKLLGGVAAGVAAYFGWDVTVTRLLLILSFFLPYCPVIIVYLICWLVIPEARTAAEKLSMRGEEVTIENIGRTVTDGFEKETEGSHEAKRTDPSRTFLQKAGDVFVSIAAILFKVFLVALVILCFPVLFALALILVLLVFSIVAMVITGGAVMYEWLPAFDFSPLMQVSPMMTMASFFAGVVVLGIPIGVFLYTLLRHFFHWEPMGTGLKWTLFLLWMVGAVLMIVNLSGIHCPALW